MTHSPTLTPLVHALHGLRDAFRDEAEATKDLRINLQRCDPLDTDAHMDAFRDFSDQLMGIMHRREACHEDAVKWGRDALDKIERLEEQVERLRKGRVA